MNINTTPKPLAPTQTKLARSEVLQALRSVPGLGSISAQNDVSRVKILIGNMTTYWEKGLSAETPPFIQITVAGTRRVFIRCGELVAVYEGRDDDWQRCRLLQTPDEILTLLPKRAVSAAISTVEASDKQLAALRKFLDLDPEFPLPTLGTTMASRLINRMTIERKLPFFREDIERWRKNEELAVTPELSSVAELAAAP